MKMTTAFEVLADSGRRQILDLLGDGECPVNELVVGLQMSQPSVSKHLRVLREAGMVEARTDAQRRLYRIRPDSLREIDEWLAPFRTLWESSLDALGHHLDTMKTGPRPHEKKGEK